MARHSAPSLETREAQLTAVVREYQNAGFDGHLPKPIGLSTLSDSLGRILSQPPPDGEAPTR